MSKLISGKEALIALANGERIEYSCDNYKNWQSADIADLQIRDFGSGHFEFRIKPRTITINGIEVPAPFEPKEGDIYFHIWPIDVRGYKSKEYSDSNNSLQFGAWRTEEEIKQVVAALRKVFEVQP